MWRATFKSLLAHKVRLVLTALAVVMGVSFVAGTLVLTDTMNSTFDELFREVTAKTSVEVRSPSGFRDQMGTEDREPVPASLVAEVREVDGVAEAVGTLSGYAQVVDPKTGKAVGTGQAPTIGVSWIESVMSSLTLEKGRGPAAPDEVAIDAGTARKHKIAVGTRVTVLLQGPPRQVTVVGTFRFGAANNLAGATLTAFDVASAHEAFGKVGRFDSIAVRAEDGVSDTALKSRIRKALGGRYEVLTGIESGEQAARALNDALGFFNTALLVFAGIAIFVGGFIIFNTFTILVAQRTRELALLRALGASRRQVLRSVLAEAALVGVVSSAAGLGLGVLMAVGLKNLLAAFGIELPGNGLTFLPHTVVWAFVVGIGVTTAASVLPARRAAAVPPVAAMRDADLTRPKSLRRRAIAGGALTALGVALLAVGLFGDVSNAASVVGLGAAATFYGVATLSPLISRPVVRAIGAPLPRLFARSRRTAGVAKAVEIGRQNALRNARRTASTAAALMVGLALVSAVSVLGSSIKASVADLVDRTFGADYVINAAQYVPFSSDLGRQVARQPEVAAAAAMRWGSVKIGERLVPLAAADPAAVEQVIAVDMASGRLTDVGDGEVALLRTEAAKLGVAVGDSVPVRFAATGEQPLRVAAIYESNQLLGGVLVTVGTYDRHIPRQLDAIVLVKARPGVPLDQVRDAVERVADRFPNVAVKDQAELKRDQQAQVDQILGLITALLALSVLIAVLGIMNTLALSIFERTRELGLVRAVGMTRRQVRAMVRYESVVIALFGAALGLGLGTLFGWALVRAFSDDGIEVLAIPVGRLVSYVVVAGVFGVVAAIWPARRAAKLDVLRAIAYE